MNDPEEMRETPSGRGPEGDFVSLFLADQRRIHRYIVTLLGRQQDAEDLLQETAAILWRKFGEFQPGTSFYAWSCRAAYLNVQEYRRKRSRDVVLLDADVLEQLATFYATEEATFDEIQIEALESCLEKLVAKDRQLIERCYASTGIRAKQVAEELGRPADSVYRSLGRIRNTLLICIRRAAAAQEHGKEVDR
jgi:RNA polymerase sigma-70 factor (ECF subfamily)